MKNVFRRLAPSNSDPVFSLRQQRERLLNLIMFCGSAIGAVLYISAYFPVAEKNLPLWTIAFYTVIFGLVLFVAFVRQVPFHVRAGFCLVIIYSLGVYNLVLNGFNVDAGLFLLTYIAMSVLFYDIAGGLIATSLSGLAVIAAGLAFVRFGFPVQMGLEQTDKNLWIIGGIILILVSVLLILTINSLIRGLEASLAKSAQAAEKLKEAMQELWSSEERFRSLIENSMDVTATLERDGTIRYISASIQQLLGYAPGELIGKSIFAFIHPDDRAKPMAALGLETSVETVGPTIEVRVQHRDGSWRFLGVRGREAYGNPAINGAIINCRDITARKEAERKLQEALESLEQRVQDRTADLRDAERARRISETHYDRLYETMRDAFVAVRMDGRIIQCNQAYLDMLGYSAEEIGRLTYMELTPAKWHSMEAEIIEKQILPRGYSDVYEKEYIRKDGSVIPVELRTKLLRSDPGQPEEMWAIVRDISERKKTEAALQSSRENYRILIDNSLQGIVVFQDMRGVYINQVLADILGYTLEEARGMSLQTVLELVHPDDRAAIAERLQARMHGLPVPDRDQLRLMNKNGEYRWLETRTIPIDYEGRPALQTIVVDNTERKHAEEVLIKSEERYRTLAEAAHDMIFIVDRDDRVQYVNSFAAMSLGLPVDQIVGRPRGKFFASGVDSHQRSGLQHVIENGAPHYAENANTFPDKVIWLGTWLVPLRDDRGQVNAVLGVSRDITERKHSEEMLRESEARFSAAFHAGPTPQILSVIESGEILDVNQAYCTLVGYTREKLLHNTTLGLKLWMDEDRQRVLGELRRTGRVKDLEVRIRTQSGELRDLIISIEPIDLEGRQCIISTGLDITERRRAELELIRSHDKLESSVRERTMELQESQSQLRQLTKQTIEAQEEERKRVSRELHDDAGQTLVTLKYSLANALSELPEGESQFRTQMENAMKAVDQSIQQVRSLAHSLRPPALEVGGLNISLKELCREIATGARLSIEYSGEEIPYLPDEISISLYRFAQETLTNVMKHAGATSVQVTMQKRPKQIVLSVSDNGKGFPEKMSREGIGLLGIEERLRLLNGELIVEPRPGGGTRVTARVPWNDAS